jgi:hypothetical protein
MGRNARRASETTLSKLASLAAWGQLVADLTGRPDVTKSDAGTITEAGF